MLLSSFCILSTLYLYHYPYFHRCAVPLKVKGEELAPFRLLVFADPQLEGDTSLPSPSEPYFPSLSVYFTYLTSVYRKKGNLHLEGRKLWQYLSADLARLLKAWLKRIDLVGNDLYLAHVYRTMYWYTRPTHVTVLGDLLGSQWISDDEFQRRGNRFWKTVFRGGQPASINESNFKAIEELQPDSLWAKNIINVAGNHDIGYAGDLNETLINRFEQIFGKVNWEAQFRASKILADGCPDKPEIRVVVLNSMNLDTRAISSALQIDTYNYINDVIINSRPVEDRCTFTILLTHIPLYKDAGICVDPPFFDYYSSGETKGGIREQNHISYGSSKGILEGIYGMTGNRQARGQGIGRNGIILTGHDHEGCDVYHHVTFNSETKESFWSAVKWPEAQVAYSRDVPGIREVTVRSMMGAYSGNAGLLSVWFDSSSEEWVFDYTNCTLGVQHVWWFIHIADVVVLLLLLLVLFAHARERSKITLADKPVNKYSGEIHEPMKVDKRSENRKSIRRRRLKK